MTLQGRTISLIVCAMLLLPFQHKALSQSDSLLKASTESPAGKSNSLMAGAGYGNNLIYLGSTISEDQPYGYAALSYGFKNTLYLTVSAVHLAKHDPFGAFYTGTLSFSHTFNSWFDISMSASRYNVAPSLRETLFGNFWYGDITLGIDWRLLYSKLSAGFLYMDQSATYYQFRNSRYFATPAFFRKKAFISFDPYVNLLFGKLSKISIDTSTVVTVTYPFYNPGGQGQGNGQGSGNPQGTGSTTPSTTTTTQTVTTPVLSTKFGLMEADFGLPIAFNTKNFTLEAEPGFILPVFDEDYYPVTKGFVFTLSCYIKIF